MTEKTVSIQIETQDKIDMYKAIIEAIDKQIPKAPKDDGWLYCPVCGKDILTDRFNIVLIAVRKLIGGDVNENQYSV